MAQRLAEVNGIVIASKVPLGETPNKGIGKEDSRAKAKTWEDYTLAVAGPGGTVAHEQLSTIVSELSVRGILDQTYLA